MYFLTSLSYNDQPCQRQFCHAVILGHLNILGLASGSFAGFVCKKKDNEQKKKHKNVTEEQAKKTITTTTNLIWVFDSHTALSLLTPFRRGVL